MNEIRLGGWFATEVAFGLADDGSETGTFIIRVARPGGGEDCFRIVCVGDAAAAVGRAFEQHLLMGVAVEVEGRLAQETMEDSQGQSVKTVRVVADKAFVGRT